MLVGQRERISPHLFGNQLHIKIYLRLAPLKLLVEEVRHLQLALLGGGAEHILQIFGLAMSLIFGLDGVTARSGTSPEDDFSFVEKVLEVHVMVRLPGLGVLQPRQPLPRQLITVPFSFQMSINTTGKRLLRVASDDVVLFGLFVVMDLLRLIINLQLQGYRGPLRRHLPRALRLLLRGHVLALRVVRRR